MKKLEELGISPTPWSVRGDIIRWINDRDGFEVCNDLDCQKTDEVRKANARIVKAAPKLYENLREIYELVKKFEDEEGVLLITNHDKVLQALAEASGEDVTND